MRQKNRQTLIECLASTSLFLQMTRNVGTLRVDGGGAGAGTGTRARSGPAYVQQCEQSLVQLWHYYW